MKILGIDHGNARIGVAISDQTGSFARPLKIVKHISRAEDPRAGRANDRVRRPAP